MFKSLESSLGSWRDEGEKEGEAVGGVGARKKEGTEGRCGQNGMEIGDSI